MCKMSCLLSRKFKLKIHNRPKKWKMACEEISIMSCDLTPLDLHYLCIYTLRVRANMNGHYSEWVQKDFAPAKDGEPGEVGPTATTNMVNLFCCFTFF